MPGVGPKTAAKWITTYGDLDGIVANVDQIGGKAGESLRAHLDGVIRNRRLNELVRDLELPLGVPDLARQVWDREQVHQLFDNLEFRVLRERLFTELESVEPEAEGGFDVAGVRLAPDEVAGWLADQAPVGVRAGVCVVGRWGRGTGDAQALAVATADGAAAYISLTDLDQAAEAALAAWLADPLQPKAFHDVKGPMEALAARGLHLRGVASDTILAAYLVQPDQRSYDLKDLVLRHLGRDLRIEGETDSGQLTLDTGDGPDEADAGDGPGPGGARAGRRARPRADEPRRGRAAARRRAAAGRRAGDDGGRRHRGRRRDAGRAGVALRRRRSPRPSRTRSTRCPRPRTARRARSTSARPSSCRSCCSTSSGCRRPSAPRPATRPTPRRWPTCSRRPSTRSSGALLRHRDASRLRQTVEGLIKSVSPDGRIHTTYNQTIAATGRISSTDPNLQNIPIRTDEGRRIREVFVVGEGFSELMSADYSQIEMRIMAHLSGDEGLIEAFRSGEDLHRFVGLAGVLGRAGRGDAGDAGQDQGDELRPGLRALGVRAVPAAADQRRRVARA